MILKPLFLLFGLAFQLNACGPATDKSTIQESRPTTTSDSLPARAREQPGMAGGQPAPATPARAADDNFRISRSRVGPVKIGMPVAGLKQAFASGQLRETTIHLEGQGYKAYVTGSPAAGLRIEEQCEPACVVWRIQVKDPAYRTAQGLGVGSRLGEVKKYYPISFLGSGETEIVAVSNQEKLTFLLDVSKLSPEMVPRLNLQNTPDSVKVLGMLIL
jgi:hypothetical protein